MGIRAPLQYACLAFVLSINEADGASTEYCRPYARDMTQAAITYIWNRAYTTCLNSDEDPPLITDWHAVLGIVDPDAVGNTPATESPTGEFERKCKRNFRSWDAKTATVIRRGSKRRVPCPCNKENVCD